MLIQAAMSDARPKQKTAKREEIQISSLRLEVGSFVTEPFGMAPTCLHVIIQKIYRKVIRENMLVLPTNYGWFPRCLIFTKDILGGA